MTNTNQQLDQLAVLKERLRIKKTNLSQKLAEIEKQLEAVSTTMALLHQGKEDEKEEGSIVSPRELHGMTQLAALIYIAKKNDGRIKITEAKKLLAKAQMLTGATKNWYNLLTTVIKRSEKFKRSGPGEYELIEEEQQVVLLRKARVG